MESSILETRYALESFYFLIAGLLGFLAVAGLATAEHESETPADMLFATAIAVVAYALVGYGISYASYGFGFSFSVVPYVSDHSSEEAIATMKENYEAVYSSYADLLFQLPFVALAVGILFRTQVAMSRTKLLLFGALYSALVYPLVVKYTWGGEMLLDGVLDGFSDFSGGTVVCITGGAAALAAALFRPSTAFSTGHMPPGSFITPGIASDLDGRVSPLSLTGILMLLLGFCGLTMGSNLQVTNIENANAVASVAFNTLLAGAAGIVVSLFFTETVDSRTALGIGVSAGLAAIASWPVIESPVENLTISVLSAGASLLLYLALNNLRDSIDDTGLISGFLGGGTFGALATPFVNPDAVFAVQATGVAIVFLWSFLAAFIALAVLPGGQTIGRV